MIYDGIGMTILNYVTNLDKTDLKVDLAVINHLEGKMARETAGCFAYSIPRQVKGTVWQ